MARPNILLIMTDEERYPPPYESDDGPGVPALAADRPRSRSGHGASSSTATTRARRRAPRAGPRCSPVSTPRCTGCRRPTGRPSRATDPGMHWLDPNSVPTLGDWFRAGGYRTHYRGKWHVSHADLAIPGHARGADGLRRRRPPAARRRSRPTARPTGSTRSGSPDGSGGSPTVPPSPTAAPSATGSSPSRWSSCSTSWPPPGPTGPG